MAAASIALVSSDDEPSPVVESWRLMSGKARQHARAAAEEAEAVPAAVVEAAAAVPGSAERRSQRKRVESPKITDAKDSATHEQARKAQRGGKQPQKRPRDGMETVPEVEPVNFGARAAPPASAETAVSPRAERAGQRAGSASSSPAAPGDATPASQTSVAQSTPGRASPLPQPNGMPERPPDAKDVKAPWRLTDKGGPAFINIVLDSCITEGVELFVNSGASKYGNTVKWRSVTEEVRRCARSESGEYYGNVDWEQLRRRVFSGSLANAPKPFLSYMKQASARDAKYDSGVGQEESEIWRKARQLNANCAEAKRRADMEKEHSSEQQRRAAEADKQAAAAMHGRTGAPPRPQTDAGGGTPRPSGGDTQGTPSGPPGSSGGASSAGGSQEGTGGRRKQKPKQRARTGDFIKGVSMSPAAEEALKLLLAFIDEYTANYPATPVDDQPQPPAGCVAPAPPPDMAARARAHRISLSANVAGTFVSQQARGRRSCRRSTRMTRLSVHSSQSMEGRKRTRWNPRAASALTAATLSA